MKFIIDENLMRSKVKGIITQLLKECDYAYLEFVFKADGVDFVRQEPLTLEMLDERLSVTEVQDIPFHDSRNEEMLTEIICHESEVDKLCDCEYDEDDEEYPYTDLMSRLRGVYGVLIDNMYNLHTDDNHLREDRYRSLYDYLLECLIDFVKELDLTECWQILRDRVEKK